MRYQIVWTPRAEAELTRIWLASANRNAVTASSQFFDDNLPLLPLHMGDAIDSSVHRVARRPPLLVEFYVIEDDKKVVVQGVAAV